MLATWTSFVGLRRWRAGQVVDAADEVRPLAVAGVVEDLDRHDPRLRRDADDADAVAADRRDDAGDVRPVSVAVLWRAGADAVEAEPDVEVGHEVRMGQVDAGVEDGDPYAGSGEAGVVRVVTRRGAQQVSAERLSGPLLRPHVGCGRNDCSYVGVLRGPPQLCRTLEDEPVQSVAVDMVDAPPAVDAMTRARAPAASALGWSVTIQTVGHDVGSGIRCRGGSFWRWRRPC